MSAQNLALSTADGASVTQVYAALSQSAKEAPSLKLVQPGAPENSYLYRKVEGNLAGLPCTSATDINGCASSGTGPCGSEMPSGVTTPNPMITQPIHDWILQGAPNN